MNPEARVEQAVIKKLLEQEITVVGGTGDKILGQLEEGVEEVGGEVLPAGCWCCPLPANKCTASSSLNS